MLDGWVATWADAWSSTRLLAAIAGVPCAGAGKPGPTCRPMCKCCWGHVPDVAVVATAPVLLKQEVPHPGKPIAGDDAQRK
jgi:hypothetical protein